jgi:short-subunit dehydrogenase
LSWNQEEETMIDQKTNPPKGSKKTALVTGASSGIGMEFARIFARAGYDLALAARNREKLEELAVELERNAGVHVNVVPIDLAQTDSAEALFKKTGELGLTIDVLVNNAGFSVAGEFLAAQPRGLREMLELNIVTLTELTRLYLPGMVERKSGGIINLGSVGSFYSTPLSAGYCATKAFVLSFSEAIAEEVTGTGVTITALCPGATRTGFAARAGIETSVMFKAGAADARSVAEAGYRGFVRGKRVVVPGFMNRLLVFSGRFTPRTLAVKAAKAMMRSESN